MAFPELRRFIKTRVLILCSQNELNEGSDDGDRDEAQSP